MTPEQMERLSDIVWEILQSKGVTDDYFVNDISVDAQNLMLDRAEEIAKGLKV